MAKAKNPENDLANIIAPDSNPDVGQPAVARAPAGRRIPAAPEVKTQLSGDSLTANIGSLSDQQGLSRTYQYWVGVSPTCPVEFIDLAGINFPKVNEQLVPDPMRTGKKKRAPKVGAIVRLDESKIKLMRGRMARTIIRFLDDQGVQDEPGTGENIGDVAVRPRRGQVLTIPTEEEIQERRRQGKPTRAYTPNPKRDVPASRFMFAQLCPNQDHPERGEFYPDPLEVTGLSWPDSLDDIADILK